MKLSEEAKKKRKEYKRQWREKNKNHISEYAKQWREKNPDKIQEYEKRFWERKAMQDDQTIEGKIYKMYKDGQSLRSIASELNISHMKVKRILDNL